MGMLDIFRKKKKKISLNRKERVKNSVLRKLGRLNLDKANVHEEFSDLIKNFYKDLFHIKYEFTYDELKKELCLHKIKKTLKEDLLKFHDEFSNLKYGAEKISREELQNFVTKVKGLVKEL